MTSHNNNIPHRHFLISFSLSTVVPGHAATTRLTLRLPACRTVAINMSHRVSDHRLNTQRISLFRSRPASHDFVMAMSLARTCSNGGRIIPLTEGHLRVTVWRQRRCGTNVHPT
ncbi:hypothetical protein EDD16DRAFT_1544886 [Pisolithus croceorrhizus]|nr:hypothetical protein EDD16DRAFT_1544886 [Pisolithus croceorrhizus]